MKIENAGPEVHMSKGNRNALRPGGSLSDRTGPHPQAALPGAVSAHRRAASASGVPPGAPPTWVPPAHHALHTRSARTHTTRSTCMRSTHSPHPCTPRAPHTLHARTPHPLHAHAQHTLHTHALHTRSTRTHITCSITKLLGGGRLLFREGALKLMQEFT